MMSCCGFGSGSGGPADPHSSGRRTNAVLKPQAFAASRSKLWQATMQISCGFNCRYRAAVWYDSGKILYLPIALFAAFGYTVALKKKSE